MTYANNTYEIKNLFVCNLKKLGTELSDDQLDTKFIICRYDEDLGYDCLAGRYVCIFVETILGFKVDSIRSANKISNPPYDTEIIYNAESIDMNLFTKEEGYVSDLRLMQIYNTINFNNRIKNRIEDIKTSADVYQKIYVNGNASKD